MNSFFINQIDIAVGISYQQFFGKGIEFYSTDSSLAKAGDFTNSFHFVGGKINAKETKQRSAINLIIRSGNIDSTMIRQMFSPQTDRWHAVLPGRTK